MKLRAKMKNIAKSTIISIESETLNDSAKTDPLVDDDTQYVTVVVSSDDPSVPADERMQLFERVEVNGNEYGEVEFSGDIAELEVVGADAIFPETNSTDVRIPALLTPDEQHPTYADGEQFNEAGSVKLKTTSPTSRTTGRKQRLRRHFDEKEKSFECDVCGKMLSNLSSHKYHMQLHSNETPFLCANCGKGFKTRNAYDGHLVTHLTKNPNTCNICGNSYRQSASLRSHMLTHTGEKVNR